MGHAILIVLAAAYTVQFGVVVGLWALAKFGGRPMARVQLGYPALLRFSAWGTSVEVGLPIGWNAWFAEQRGVALASAAPIWRDAETEKLQRERAEKENRLAQSTQHARWTPLLYLALWSLGLALLGFDVALAARHSVNHVQQIFSELWAPWSRGADAVRRATNFLANAPLLQGYGIILVRHGAVRILTAVLRIILLSVGWEGAVLITALAELAICALWIVAVLAMLLRSI